MKNNQFLTLDKITKFYNVSNDKHKLHVLDNISLTIQKGSFVSFFGPNGCGKSTIMQIIAGILKPESGKINFANAVNIKKSFIFQNFFDTLFPWMTCLDNIAFPLEVEGVTKETRVEMAKAFVKEMNLDMIPLHKYPYQLSGGQRQIVAIARALINDPDVLLMDEPFVALDYSTRLFVGQKLLDIWNKKRVTTILVSHDIDDAIYLSDMVVVLDKKPARIVEEIPINLMRPRNLKMMKSTEFNDIKSRIISKLYGEIF